VSTARLQLEAPKGQGQRDEADRTPSLVNAAQALTGSAILDQVRPHLPPGQAGTAGMPGMLSATPIAGSSVIELRAEGGNAEALAQILTVWIEAYRRSQVSGFDRSSAEALEEARGAFTRLKEEVAAKRREAEEFRSKHDIVSTEREENQATARLRGINEAMNEARNRQVNAEARLNALRENLAAGKGAGGADGSAVAGLEKSASDLRERMKDLEQEYTARYLALDNKYKAMQANLARIEQQIERERRAGATRALQKEEQEVESARQAVLRLQEELATRKRDAHVFMARFSENVALTNELKRLEEAHDTARERVAQLEEAKKAARPGLTVLNLPTVPDRPDRPDYWRDAAVAVAGAAALGFLAVWFVEFFTRSGMPRPEPAAQPVIHITYPPGVPFDPRAPMLDVPAVPAIGGAAIRLPEALGTRGRELSGSEVHALWAAAVPDAQLVIAGLLGGISPEELAALRYEHVDLDASYLRVPGISGRACTLRDPLRRLLIERRRARGGAAPLADARGAALTAADLDGLIACAAHDAGLTNAGEVTSETLRRTYFAYLVRQGARLAEIGEFIGRLSPAAYREYGQLSPHGPGRPLEEIDPVFPALRAL
jgi:uncharacterized protein involved in exopolysaccharide biosynthesis